MLANGRSEREVAKKLGLSIKTVSTYKQRIFEKMDFERDVDMYRYAFERGI